MEVNSVHVHLVAHSQEIPVDLLALGHLQSMEVAVQLTIDPFNRHNETVTLVDAHIHRITDMQTEVWQQTTTKEK